MALSEISRAVPVKSPTPDVQIPKEFRIPDDIGRPEKTPIDAPMQHIDTTVAKQENIDTTVAKQENTDKNGNTATTNTANNTRKANQTQPDQAEEMQAATGASGEEAPWYDPFGWTEEAQGEDIGGSEPILFAAAALTAAFIYFQ